jgi:protein-glutamine gamma-glutamyltransferase
MSAPTIPVDRASRFWLLAAALCCALPHVRHLPVWLSLFAALVFLLATWTTWRVRPQPRRLILFLGLAVAYAGIFLEYHTLFGRDAGVALVFVLLNLKLLELRSRRDAYALVMLGFFVLLTHYFYTQDIPTALWLITSAFVLVGALVRLHSAPGSDRRAAREAATLLLQGLPFLLILYVLFPRVSGPLWGLPEDAHGGLTGLSDRMTPGSLANLIADGSIAFRVRFTGPPPAQDRLYWRGPVLEHYEAGTWRQDEAGGAAPPILVANTPSIGYEMTIEPNNQRWLLALDLPTQLPPDARLDGTLSALLATPLRQRQRFELASATVYRTVETAAETQRRQRDLQLPPGNPRTRALALAWRREDPRPPAIVARALTHFRNENFVYTLRPPMLPADNPVDAFLFSTRRGFCEHYAAAFVVLMRAAGVPARVVTGYQGGEINPVDGYLVVRQSDAHAWAEVWIDGEGWRRVDPTAAISPARVESGVAAALSPSGSLPLLMRLDAGWLRDLRHRWEAVNNGWNQWVLGYNPQRQKELLQHLGLPDADWSHLAALLAAACGALLLALLVWALRPHRDRDPAWQLWQDVVIRLRRRDYACTDWETPRALALRIATTAPALGEALAAIADAIYRLRYAGNGDLRQTRMLVRRLVIQPASKEKP